MNLTGTITALITPFTADGTVDYDALSALIEKQCEAGIEGILMLGTTGESPTITHEEFTKIVTTAKETINGRSKLIVGTGSNDTQKTLTLSREAADLGADALLVVNPYYNKPTQDGLYQHFMTIADGVDCPQIVYNIKGRTAVNVETATLMKIATHKNIIAVKEASGDLGQMMSVIDAAPDGFSVLSGDDNMTYPLIACGGHGVVSVLSNLLPNRVKAMVDAALAGNFAEARVMHYKLAPLMKGCFIETNPLPIKTAIAMRGDITESFRLPMCPMQEGNKTKLGALLKEHGVL